MQTISCTPIPTFLKWLKSWWALKPRMLGVTFDTHLTFFSHIDSIFTGSLSRINIPKVFAATNWCQQRETIAYKSLIQIIFIYDAPVWFNNAASSWIDKIKTLQDSALRHSHQCVKMTSIDYLHNKTKVLPVHNRLSLLHIPNISPQPSNLTTLPTM